MGDKQCDGVRLFEPATADRRVATPTDSALTATRCTVEIGRPSRPARLWGRPQVASAADDILDKHCGVIPVSRIGPRSRALGPSEGRILGRSGGRQEASAERRRDACDSPVTRGPAAVTLMRQSGGRDEKVSACGPPKRRVCANRAAGVGLVRAPWDNLMSHCDTGAASADACGYHPCTAAAASARRVAFAPGAP